MAQPRGRKPKPSHLKEVEGNPGKRPLNENEPRPRPVAPACPRWLPPEAKKEWKRVAPILKRLGLLTEIDGDALMAYCWAVHRFKHAARMLLPGEDGKYKDIVTTPNGHYQANPYVTMANQALKEMRAFQTEFGMTPSSRSRITLPGLEEDDEMEALLKVVK